MAGLSTKELKSKIRSMQSTRQITKAMEMVASSKLRGAQERVLRSRPYFETLYAAMTDLASARQDSGESPFSQKRETGKLCAVVIAGDRGLAGGYNANVLKTVWQELEGTDCCVLPIGKKAVEFFRRRGVPMLTEQYAEAAEVTVGNCFSIAKLLSGRFLKGDFRKILLGYTNFVSVLSQSPAVLPMLPLDAPPQRSEKFPPLVLCEPDPETVYNAIVPEYLGGLIYGAICESVAAEQAARRNAMDAATKNADEMIEDLGLRYNRARQGAITQEITEIVAGAESN